MNYYRVSTSTYNDVVTSLKDGKKIAAIKALRSSTSCGLKEAKLAVERLAVNIGVHSHRDYKDAVSSGAAIVCGPAIKKLVVNYGDSDIEVDLEGMQLRALMEMSAIGLDACRDILTLVDTLTAFSEGKQIGVLPDEEAKEKV